MLMRMFAHQGLQLQILRPRTLFVALLIVPTLLSTGCWFGGSSPEPDAPEEQQDAEAESEAKELSATDTSSKTSNEKPQTELARIAKKLYQSKMYSVSRESFQSLGSEGAPGAYRTFVEIKLADSYFFNGEHNEASKRYEEFAKNYPSSPEVPYAKLQAAHSYLALARGTGRDRKPLEAALALFDDLAKRYLDSDYGVIAKQARIPVIKELAAYDQGIIDFYERLGNTAAVAERTQAFEAQWGTRLQESASAQVLGAEKRLLPLVPVEQQAPGQNGLALAASPEVTKTAPSSIGQSSSPITVRQVTCRRGSDPYVLLYVDKLPDAFAKLGSYEATPTDAGLLRMSGFGFQSPRQEFNCFGTKDLRITPQGAIELKTSTAMAITGLDAPPRLLLSRLRY